MTFWIGNTADFGVSGLDERQAAGLLSAVGGNGLSLVEPGPATDPVAAGLNAAIGRARLAWERTQPQLFWTDENLWGVLDAADAGAVRCIEPADMSPLTATPRGGLDLTFDGDGANPSKEARRPRKGA